ncbi:RIMS-binding protein 2 isoform X3 [Coccinella septempunctata]|uniref:RIMS-binding protein 2 isoform X3 n=1 Tax=Coccinella septempunctata TaxID=41139 RepID=UPI001D068883|nr:RIMS-binding protein 2 isoform X3 [Coccinella septempunctata]
MNIEMQLKAAEARRNELERQHAEALAALRGCGADTLEAHQSRVRELEKKVALETVRCEELQLEMSTPPVRRNGDGVGHMTSSSYGVTSGQAVSGGSWTNKGTEIERIMAKIEQDNRILAELDHNRATTMGQGLATSASSHALGECSPPLSPITMSHTTPSIYPGNMGAHNSYQPSSLQSTYLPSNVQQNPTSNYNTSPYNTYQHSSYSKPSTMMGSSMTHHNTSLGNPLGQTSASMLGTNLTSNLQTSIGGNFGGTSLTNVGLNMVPSSYTTSTLGNTNTFSNPLGTNINTGLTNSTFNNPSYTNPITNTLSQFSSLPYNPATTSSFSNNVTFSNPLTQYNSLPLSGAMSMKLKQLEETDLGIRRVPTPVTPHNNPTWGLTSNLTGMTDTRPRGILNDGLDSEWSTGLHDRDRSFLNGHNVTNEGQVDMLDIPGKGRCSVYIARFSYEPEPDIEEELAIQAGDYLLVWGDPVGPGGFLDAELLDGRRGLVPSHFVQRLIGDDLLEFHQAVLSTLREEEINQENFAADVQRLNEIAEMSENQEDDGPEGEQGKNSTRLQPYVPAPRQLTLERQLNKSVLISWTTPENVGPGNHIESYHVYVDGVLKATIKATERTRALVEGVDSNKPHRISVRSVTMNRRTSRDAACTMIIGKDTHQLGPSSVRATNITSTSAVISWLPANSNHQHVVCVNNVEVRTVKPGVYRHTITGLTANTQYRVTVRAKHHRAAQNVANLAEELPMPAAAHTDFRTLPKGLPDPPSDIMVEPGPQDGTLLVTWHPIQTPHHPGSSVTGYAVYADGKKVTDVDSPTGDHALIDISKLLGLNPKHVTVRTKARDSQSTDSLPTPIPMSVLRGGAVKNRQQPHSAVMPPHIRQQMPRQQQQGQQVIEPEENLSDKEIFPNQMGHRQQGGIPSIAQRPLTEITKESYESNMSEDEILDRRNQRQYQQGRNQQQGQQQQRNQQQQQRMDQQGQQQGQNQQQYYQQQAQQNTRQMQMRGQQMQQQGSSRGQQVNQQTNPNNPPNPQKRARWFFALFDYDPATMSPNPDACDEELPFSEGDTIKVWGDKDADGFYWGECRGRRGYVPHNMVMEVEGQQNRDRWGDIYANMPVKRMVALYDYDPHELSPNVDAENPLQVELSFTTGQIINVYGDMDDDGFYMGEIDGVRGLVPSNFLTEAPDQYGGGQTSQSGQGGMGRGQRSQRGIGPGARGPPPPPRDAQMRPTRSKDACPTVLSSSQLDNVNTASTPNTTQNFNEHNQGRGRGAMNQGGNQQTPVTQQQQQQSTASSIFSSIMGVASSNTPQNQQQQQQQQQNQQQNQQNMQQGQQQTYGQGQQQYGQQNQQQFGQQNQPRMTQMKGVPQVVPTVMGTGAGNMANQQGQPGAPNLMQKLNEITAPGGDILSKGKELIFMKFGLGGK